MLKDIQWVKVMHGSACGKSYSIFPFSLRVKVPCRKVNFTTFARMMHSFTSLPTFAAPPPKTHKISLILQRCIAASSKWPEWNFSSMDVLRKETDYFTCCFRFIVGWPLAVRKPRGHLNLWRTVSKHPRVSMTKSIFKICLGRRLQFCKTYRERGRDEKIRRMCSSPNWAAETNKK